MCGLKSLYHKILNLSITKIAEAIFAALSGILSEHLLLQAAGVGVSRQAVDKTEKIS